MENLEKAQSKASEIIAALVEPLVCSVWGREDRKEQGSISQIFFLVTLYLIDFSMATEAGVKLQEDLRYWMLGQTFAVRGVKCLIL